MSPRKLPAKKARAFLTTDPPARPGRRCCVCARPEIAADVLAWAEHRAAGGYISLGRFHERHLSVVHSDCPSFGSARGHVVRCLRRDNSTGKPL